MYGRDRERAAVERLLADARSGRSGALVLRGEPGVGKSMLLEHAAATAGDLRVLRGIGVESEVDLAFAGLHQLLRPVLDLLDRLPQPQARALDGAFGLVPRGGEDRFLVAVAVLTLLSEAAEHRPIVCLIDDLHWVDRASVDALSFVARRLDAEGVVLLGAIRQEAPAGFRELWIDGLDPAAATALLRARDARLTPDACARLIEETGGNPLALMELSGTLSPQQLAERGPLPLTERVRHAFADQVRRLPEPTQRMLLTAAADDTGDLRVILQAAQAFGTSADAFGPAERAGLVRLDGKEGLAFRHPLVRAAVYQSVPLSERLAAHRALAGALDGQADRRAWHLAASTLIADEGIAAELDRSGEQARRRGAPAVAATAFDRAAELSPTPSSRGRRLAAAAQASYDAGQIDRAAALAGQAEPLVNNEIGRAEITALRGAIELVRGSGAAALPLLVEAARALAEHDPDRAVLLLVDAVWAAISTCDQGRMAQAIAGFDCARLPVGHPLRSLVVAHRGFGEFYTGHYATGLGQIRDGIDALVRQAGTGHVNYLATAGILVDLAIAIGDDAAGLALATAAVTHFRRHGLVGLLPMALATSAFIETHAGRHAAARAHAIEGLRLARDLGQHHAAGYCAAVLAWLNAAHGQDEDCRRFTIEAAQLADETEFVTVANARPYFLGLLDLSLSHPAEALNQFMAALHGLAGWPFADIMIVPDLVEAAARAGRPECAAEPLARFERWAKHVRQPWADAVRHRSRALLATGDDEANEHFRTAIRLHDKHGPQARPYDRARTQLLYGEWLRRAHHRVQARTHLTGAYEIFDRLGATVWADRAAAELRATGKTVRRRDPGTARQLTPQELQVVRMAAEGARNKDIAGQLFLSPRTVGYHLSNAYRKLGIASRHELARLDLGALTTPAGRPDQ